MSWRGAGLGLVLAMASGLGTPGVAAASTTHALASVPTATRTNATASASTSPVAVTVAPEQVEPGDTAVVSFTPVNEWTTVVACEARLDGAPLPACGASDSTTREVRFDVPPGTSPGLHSIDYSVGWTTSPPTTSPPVLTHVPSYDPPPLALLLSSGTKGSLELLVVPTVTAALDRTSAHRGDTVTATFTPQDSKVAVTSCSLTGLRGGSDACRPEPGSTSATVTVSMTVPDDAPLGPSHLEWGLDYAYARTTGTRSGRFDFTVLADPVAAGVTATLDDADVAPGEVVRLRLVPVPDGVRITSCSARLANKADLTCAPTADGWVVEHALPGDAAPGSRRIRWSATYVDERRERRARTTAPGTATGSVTFSVTAATPRFSGTIDPAAAEPADHVLLAITTRSTGVEVVDCAATLFGRRTTDCTVSPGGGTVALTIPPGSTPGTSTIGWSVTYRLADGRSRTARGSTPLTVLPALDPEFAVTASAHEVRVGDELTLTYAVTSGGASVTACSATVLRDTDDTCRPTGGAHVVRLRIPDGVRDGPLHVDWRLTWNRPLASGTASRTGVRSGTIVLLVVPRPSALAPVLDWVGDHTVGVAALLAAAGLVPLTRHRGHRRSGAGAPDGIPAPPPITVRTSEREPVRAVARHPDGGPTTCIRLVTTVTREALELRRSP